MSEAYYYYDEDISTDETIDIAAFLEEDDKYMGDSPIEDGSSGDPIVIEYKGSDQDINAQIPQASNLYTVTVTNTDLVNHQTVLFGASTFLQSTNFGNPAGINVNVAESSYFKLLKTSELNPFVIVGIKSISTNFPQLSQPVRITDESASGRTISYVLQTETYFLTRQFQTGVRMIQPLKIEVDGDTQFNFTTFSLTTVVFTLYTNPLCRETCPPNGDSSTKVTTRIPTSATQSGTQLCPPN